MVCDWVLRLARRTRPAGVSWRFQLRLAGSKRRAMVRGGERFCCPKPALDSAICGGVGGPTARVLGGDHMAEQSRSIHVSPKEPMAEGLGGTHDSPFGQRWAFHSVFAFPNSAANRNGRYCPGGRGCDLLRRRLPVGPSLCRDGAAAANPDF